MPAETSQLLARLKDLLIRREELEAELARGPKRIAASEKKIETSQAAGQARKDEIQSLRKDADQHSLSLKSKEAEIAKLATRLNEAASNKEYDIIKGQIEAAKNQVAELEDTVLQRLTAVDDAASALEADEAATANLQKDTDQLRNRVAEKEPELRKQIDELNGRIAEDEKSIQPDTVLDRWTRMIASVGSAAVAPIDDGFCSSCNTRVTSQDAVRVNVGDFINCRECGSFLYNADHADPGGDS